MRATKRIPRICSKPDKDTLQARVDKELYILAPSHIPLQRFTVDAITKEGCLVPRFLKLVRVITHFTDFTVIKSILEWGLSQGIFLSESNMTVREFANLCSVLRKPEGQAAVTAQLRRLNLERKAATCSTSVSSIALTKILNSQLQDYYIRVKRLREEGSGTDDTAEPKRKVRRVEKNEKPIDVEMVPASRYTALRSDVVRRQAVERYKMKAKVRGNAVPEDKAGPLPPAVKMYCKSVTAEHMVQFCEKEGAKEQLVAYAQKKILELDATWENRRANRLRHTLACVDVGSSAAEPGKSTNKTGKRFPCFWPSLPWW